MQFWQTLLEKPSGEKAMDDFAISIDRVQKLVFSNTLTDTGWESAKLANKTLDKEISGLKQQPGKNILVGSRSLIIQLLNSGSVDELQICIHPVLEGKGLLLFDQIKDRILLKLIKTKSLTSGSLVLYYEPMPNKTTNR